MLPLSLPAVLICLLLPAHSTIRQQLSVHLPAEGTPRRGGTKICQDLLGRAALAGVASLSGGLGIVFGVARCHASLLIIMTALLSHQSGLAWFGLFIVGEE